MTRFKMKHTIVLAGAIFAGLTAVVGAQVAVGKYIRMRTGTTVPTPVSGFVNVYWNSVDNSLHRVDSTGSDSAIGGGSGTVTSITMGTGLSSTQNPLTTSGTMSIDQSFTPTWTGAHIFQNNGIGTAQTVDVTVQNTTAALVAAQQYAPMVCDLGNTWETTGPSSQTAGWCYQAQGFNAATPSSALSFYMNHGGSLQSAMRVQAATNLAGVGSNGSKIYGTNDTSGVGVPFLLLSDSTAGLSRWILGSNDGSGVFIGGNNNITNGIELDSHAGGVTFNVDGGGAVYPFNDSNNEFGSSGHRWVDGYFGAAIASQPSCDANHRGAMMTIFATTGNSDTFQICMKAAADTYAWRTVFTAP